MNRESKQASARITEMQAAFVPFNTGMMAAFAEASQAYLKGMVAMNQEVMSFANTRLRTNADVSETLSKCENWADAARLHQDWSRTAAEAYFTETTKLMELATQMTVESWAPLLESVNGALRERSERKKA